MRIALVASLLVIAAPALAAVQNEQAPPKPAKTKKICKSETERTESRMPRRTCKTVEQWDEERGASQDQINRLGK